MTINHQNARDYARGTSGENEMSAERQERERQRFLNYFGVEDPQDDPETDGEESLSEQSSSDEVDEIEGLLQDASVLDIAAPKSAASLREEAAELADADDYREIDMEALRAEATESQSSPDESGPKIVEIDLDETHQDGGDVEALTSTPGWEALSPSPPSSHIELGPLPDFD